MRGSRTASRHRRLHRQHCRAVEGRRRANDRARRYVDRSRRPGSTNGYSLARRVCFDVARLKHDTFVRELDATVGDALLAPHRSYLSLIRPLLRREYVKGLAHITGGGITENLPRVLPEGCAAEIDRRSWTPPPIFRLIQERGGVSRDEMSGRSTWASA